MHISIPVYINDVDELCDEATGTVLCCTSVWSIFDKPKHDHLKLEIHTVCRRGCVPMCRQDPYFIRIVGSDPIYIIGSLNRLLNKLDVGFDRIYYVRLV